MNRYAFYGLLALGVAARTWMLLDYGLVDGGDVDVYLADEGIVGLMARHIAEGREAPVFFYGQAYLGALEAYCAALLFRVFGASLETLRLVPYLFSLGLMAAVFRYTYRAYSVVAARWATAIVAVAPMYFLQWNLKARGGFVEHIVLLFVVMILFWRFFIEHDRRGSTGLALGFAAGVALWVNQLALAYLIVFAAVLVLASHDRRGLAPIVVGFTIGAALLIGYNVVHPMETVKALTRKAIVLNRVPVEERDESWAARGVAKRLEAIPQGAGKLGLVFGVPPSASLERLGMAEREREGGPLTPLRSRLWPLPALVFGIAWLSCRPRRGADGLEPLGSSVLLGLVAAVTVVVGYVSPRYMLPAYPLAGVMAAVLVARLPGARRRAMTAGVAAVLAFNVAGWVDAMVLADRDAKDRTDGAELLAYLEGAGIEGCYSAGPLYHVVFLGEERVLISPLQKNRYPAYDAAIEKMDNICYAFRDDQAGKRQHRAFLGALKKVGARYQSERVGAYNVLSSFTPRAAVGRELVDRARVARSGNE